MPYVHVPVLLEHSQSFDGRHMPDASLSTFYRPPFIRQATSKRNL
jgi:hypothetical protein